MTREIQDVVPGQESAGVPTNQEESVRPLGVSFLIPAGFALAAFFTACTGPEGDPPETRPPGGSTEENFPTLTGPYLGQAPALAQPAVFAPGVVSGGFSERDVAMTPDGSEIYWGVTGANYVWSTILMSRQEEGRWTEPVAAPCCRDLGITNLEPHITPDGRHFMWLSDRPGVGRDSRGGQDIWVMDREGDGWGEPYPLPALINSPGSEYFPSTTRDGTLYFTRGPAGGGENLIYRSRFVDGEYQEPERLPPEVNAGLARYNAFVDPDEGYLILGVAGMEDSFGGTDYYVVFRNENDDWSRPINLGPLVNTAGNFEFSPYVSPDGEFFFFMTTRPDLGRLAPGGRVAGEVLMGMAGEHGNGGSDIYWMRASFLESLRPEGF